MPEPTSVAAAFVQTLAPDQYQAYTDRIAEREAAIIAACDPADARDGSLTIGTLTVPEGGEVFLAHPEHAFLAVAPGTYYVGRQREWAGEWRMVAD